MRNQIRLIVAVFLPVFGVNAAVYSGDEAAGTARVLRPFVSFVGVDAQIAEHQCVRITDDESWVRFWLRHAGKARRLGDYNEHRRNGVPEIDFDQCMVIAITGSRDELNAGNPVIAVTESKKQITFDCDNMRYQPQKTTSTRGNAYGYFILPRSAKPVVVRHNMQGSQGQYRGRPPFWEEVARIASLVEMDNEPVALNVVFGHDPGKGKYDGVVGKPNDTWNLLDVRQTSIRALRSYTGSETTVGFQVSENDGEWGIEGHSGVFHAYIYHNSRCVDLQAKFSGLAPGRYKIYVYAHGDAPDQNANIELAVGPEIYGSKSTLDDGSWDYRSKTFAEGVQYVSFEFVVTNFETVKITSRRAGSPYSMFNAIQIVPIVK